MTSWIEKTNSPNKAFIVLDGKNEPHDIWGRLQTAGYDAHIFVAQKDGSHRHNPPFKGGDFSTMYREGEISAIKQIHEKKGWLPYSLRQICLTLLEN